MDQTFAPPTATAFDAGTAGLIAVAYVVVAIAALIRASRDARTRVFLAGALLNIGPAACTAILWREGSAAAFTRSLVLLLAATTLTGALTLFHFAQIFPWRRPWLVRHVRWLVAGYVATPLLTTALVLAAPDSFDELSTLYVLAALAIGFPLGALVGIMIPFAAVVSLYKSYLAARVHAIENARKTLLWMLISQTAGGVLAAIIIPLLHMIGMPSAWTTLASALLCLFGLLMPLAYAAGIWRLHVLDLRGRAPA